MWARVPNDKNGKGGGALESTRWTEGYTRIAEMAVRFPDSRLVYVPERVADIVALMAQDGDLRNPADWLNRSQHNWSLPEGVKLWAGVMGGEVMGVIRFTMPSRQGQEAWNVR